jgi:hypothetical protein
VTVGPGLISGAMEAHIPPLLIVLVALAALCTLASAQSPSKPVPVTVDNFIRAESHRYLGNALEYAGGLGRLGHHPELLAIDRRILVRPNRDTFDSSAVIDFNAGPVTITLPDAGPRYRALEVINEDQYVVGAVVYNAGTYTYDRKSVGTRYALVTIRILGDPRDPKDVEEVHALQDATKLTQKSPGKFEIPNWDEQSRSKIRSALLSLADTLPDYRRAFGARGQVDPVRRLIGAAAAWGGNPDRDAIYLNAVPARNDGDTVYRLEVKDVPVEGFWSISVYNAEGYFEKNAYDAYSINNITAKATTDGSVTVQFGGCDGKIPNCLPIMKGWNYMVRLYRPHAEILNGKWKFPEASPI